MIFNERYSIFERSILASNLKIKEEFKFYKEKEVIIGKFMIVDILSVIYNRFKEIFGRKLKWVRYSPYQFIEISKVALLILENKKRDECLDLINNSIQVILLCLILFNYSLELTKKN